MSSNRVAVVVRVSTPGQPAFQLRKGELGISVFDVDGVDPPLTDDEILAPFRPGSVVIYRTLDEVTDAGLMVAETTGANELPDRLRVAHRELVPPAAMSRAAFKTALKTLEDDS